MPLIIISLLIQVALVMHIVKTGRNTTWIWIVSLLPVAGAIAYLLIELLPAIGQSQTGRKTKTKITEAINPNREIRQAAKDYSRTETTEYALKLAEECHNKGLHEEAKSLYEKSLQGIHRHDPLLLVGLAHCEFELKNYAAVKTTLDELISANPDYKNQHAHLLYARALEKLHQHEQAQHEYETLHSYFTGPDATYYFAKFLQQQHQYERAEKLFKTIVTKASDANSHYRQQHKTIIAKAKAEL